MILRTLKDLNLTPGSPVVVRAELNAPVENGRVMDDSRIRAVLPTLDYLAKKKVKIIIVAHLGRPKGWDESLSLKPVGERLSALWKRKFVVVSQDQNRLPEYSIPHLYFFEHNLQETDPGALISGMGDADAVLLENLRFYPGEEKNDREFAEKLASFGKFYVNEAFGVSHRAHASLVGVPAILPGAAGLELEKELHALSRVLVSPRKPVVVLLGGVKLSDKSGAMENLLKIADAVLIGGGLANLFLKVQGFEIGKSVWEDQKMESLARRLWRDYREKIQLPVDAVVSGSRDGVADCVKAEKVKASQMILDIGPETIKKYSRCLKQGFTLIWNGPMGYFERRSFSHGSFALARLFAARSSQADVFGLAGGGETLEVISRLDLEHDIDFISTGGGAMLDFLAGKTLPAVEALHA